MTSSQEVPFIASLLEALLVAGEKITAEVAISTEDHYFDLSPHIQYDVQLTGMVKTPDGLHAQFMHPETGGLITFQIFPGYDRLLHLVKTEDGHVLKYKNKRNGRIEIELPQ